MTADHARREHVQDGYDVRCEWGREAVALLGQLCAVVVVVVDVLSFSTAVDVAAGGSIGLIPAGERWELPGEPMRPALEDAQGAGALAAAVDASDVAPRLRDGMLQP